jgi:hypothetical protein
MLTRKFISGREITRRAIALLACAAVLYFVFGAAFPHEHPNGSENTCPICQALHMPALAAVPLNPVAASQFVARYALLPQQVHPSDPFAIHRASRGPPRA